MKVNAASILRKGRVIIKVQKFKYLVEDLFDNDIITMILSGKTKIIFPEPNIGEEVYIMVPPFASTQGQMVTSTHFKQDPDLFAQKIELDKKH